MDQQKKLAQLDDLVIQEILSMSEEDLRSAATRDAADATRNDLIKAIGLLGKFDLANARAELSAYRAGSRVLPFAGKNSRELNALRTSDHALDAKLTMAARNANAGGEQELQDIEEDLAELGAWKDKDQEEK